jgi:hypothetical protein
LPKFAKLNTKVRRLSVENPVVLIKFLINTTINYDILRAIILIKREHKSDKRRCGRCLSIIRHLFSKVVKLKE